MDYFASTRSIHFSKADRILVGVSLLSSLLVLVYMLQPDDGSSRKDLKHLADLTSSEFKVRRKYSGAISWAYINKGAALFNQDEIFNDNQTPAKISFLNSKSSIILPPKSLIAIEEDHEKITLVIKEGKAELTLGKNETMNVQSGEKILNVTSSVDSKVTFTNTSGELSVSTTAGDIVVHDKDKVKSVSVKKDQILNVPSNPAAKELAVTRFKILSPVNGDEFDLYKNGFVAKLSQSLKGTMLVSKDSSFEKPVLTKQLQNDSEMDLSELKEGSYFLKVISGKETSDVRSFKVFYNPIFTPQSPLDGETLTLGPGNEAIKLTWEKQPVGTTTEIEVLNNTSETDKKPLQFNVTNGDNFLKLTGIIGEQFSWRAKTLFRDKATPFSNLNSIKLDFGRPIILEKEWISKMSSSDANIVKWNKVSEGEKFNISLIPGIDPVSSKNKALEKITAEHSINLERLRRGKYNFKISSITYPGKNNTLQKELVVYSPVFEWDKAPRITSFGAIDPEIKLNLKLNAIDSNQITMQATLNKKKEFPIALAADHSVLLKEFGSYCIKGKGRAEAFFEDTSEYCFEFKELPPFSTIAKPQDQVMKYTKNKKNNLDAYKLHASPVARAIKYEFHVYRDDQGKKEVYKNDSSSPEIEWMSNRSGVYYFRYKVYDSKGRASEFSPMSRIIFPISPIDEL